MKEYYSFSEGFGAADEFYQAVLLLDKPRVEKLKASGVSLAENVKQTLVNGGGSMFSNSLASRFWYGYLMDLESVSKLDFAWISRTFFEEIKEPLYFSDNLRAVISKYFYNKEVFTCLLECYDLKKLSKKKKLEELVRKNNVELLELCIAHGWLNQAKKRDDLIEYSNEQNRPEVTAFLLDFKNRTADLAAERLKAEKKAERELNAAPDSVLELGKLWSRKKGEDGNLIITSYKGTETEVTIPARVGKNVVTAVAAKALSYNASRTVNKAARLMIERIIVSDGIKTLGETALGGAGTWGHDPKLKEVVLPKSLEVFNDREAAETAPNFLTVYTGAVAVIPRMENAVFYCTKNCIKYRFDGEDTVHVPHEEVVASDPLFAAIMACDRERVAELKKGGAELTDYIKTCLLRETQYGHVLYDVQKNFFDFIFNTKPEDREFILSSLKAETGEPLYYDKYRYVHTKTPEGLDVILTYFSTKYLKKTWEMKNFIDKEKIDYLEVCAKHGWLKNSATRDKMIEYASEKGKTEATAWLLDYKNRTTDPVAERKRAEKRIERKLNAPPPTPEEPRKKENKRFERLYLFEINGGEVTITGYKGGANVPNEVEIPREYDGKPITAIGVRAFCPVEGNIPTRYRHCRAKVTKVILPDTLRTIGDIAFLGCNALREVVIPSSVEEIGIRAFLQVSMVKLSMTFVVEQGSFAEEYCRTNGLSFKYNQV